MDMAKDFIEGAQALRERSFNDKEYRCKRVFEWAVRRYGGVWHLCTPGKKQSVIFRGDDYVYGMTLVAMCAHDCPDVQIITFELMSNHVHFVICGTKEQVLAFFALFKKRLVRYFASIGKKVDLTHFVCEDPIAIDNVESLRNQIGYTNRNNFVVDPDQTPFSYPFGANSYFFTPVNKARKEKCFEDLTVREKRMLLHTKKIGEGVFRDARHYFNKLSKNIESYKDIAAVLGDSIYYTDDELDDILYRIRVERYGGQRIALLKKSDKLDLARELHFDYNADNGKISRLLNLDKSIVDELFPTRK